MHAALGSNTYLWGTYEEAAADEFSLDHPAQGPKQVQIGEKVLPRFVQGAH
jgi:hypothetical protein